MLLISTLFYLIGGIFCGQTAYFISSIIDEPTEYKIKKIDIISLLILTILFTFALISYFNNNLFIENTFTLTILVISTIATATFRLCSSYIEEN